MMKLFKLWIVVPTTLAVMLTSAGLVHSQSVQTLVPGFTPDPMKLTGTSEVSTEKACDKLGTTPSHVIELAQNFGYLRFSLQSDGQPTLVIQRSGQNKQCVPGSPGQDIEYPGYWEAGIYNIYIVDRAGSQHPYTLSITQVRPL